MLKPVVTVPVFAVHGLLDGARSKGLATESWLDGVLAQARIAESLLHLEQSRVTIEQYIALFSAVKNSLDDECLGHLHGRPLRCGSFALMARSTLGAKTLAAALQRVSASFALLQDDVALVPVSDGLLKGDRKSTRLNSSHSQISYAVFCLKKKKNKQNVREKQAQAVTRNFQ